MKFLFFVLIGFVFYGCSSKESVVKEEISTQKEIVVHTVETQDDTQEVLPKIKTDKKGDLDLKDGEIYDLVNIPQNVQEYLKHINGRDKLYEIQKEYERNYFHVWNIEKHSDSLNASRWPFALHKSDNSYGENLQKLDQKFFDEMYDNANFSEYSTKNIRAITIKETDIRAFPTQKPLFRDPSLAGEGYPFDYLQNSTIHANKPLFISHYSKDKQWVFVFTSFTSGWIRSDELVMLDSKYTDVWQKAEQISIVKEDEPIYDTDGNFLFKSKIGMMFALIEEDDESYKVLTVSSYKNRKPLFLKSKLSKDIAHKGVLKFSAENFQNIINEVSKTNYGWGGLYGQRDCSSMLRDLYAPFGIWLPRNSSKQAEVGKVMDLSKLSNDEKVLAIKDQAVPFEAFLYKKGHVMLYVGTHENEPIIFHNFWGVKTKKDDIEGRIVIGKPIFSTLQLGKYQRDYDEEAEILNQLTSFNIITQ